ncbi:argininosuccinate lyase [Candidatus Daviesbacteria bacterium]|nr:argininosuccinate lyase [Candidatus Daviesbacteria bacterium]
MARKGNMKKLWQKNNKKLDPVVEAFETKGDLLMDQKLIEYDILASIAHVKTLNKLFLIGIISEPELKKLLKGFEEILNLYKKGEFDLKIGDEDMHTKIENYITEKYGDIGKKIHTGRSRNDQVLTAIRLYSKNALESIELELTNLTKSFKGFSKEYGYIQMAGYTHMQKAMPSSIGLWAGSFIDSLENDLTLLKIVYKLNNQSPLGSGAGYGVPIKLDREYSAKLLGFTRVQQNPLYCQNSRGKIEASIIAALISVLQTINKFASDVLLFTTSEFSFFKATGKITTGSSIMPQKKNVDLAELLRSKVHLVLGNYIQMVSLSSNLISGYNRDLQDSKKPLIESLEITLETLMVTKILLENLTPNKEKLEAAMTEDLFATEEVLKQVLKGETFRDAYKQVGKKYLKGGDTNEKDD